MAPDHAKAHHLAGLALLGRKRPGDVESSIEVLQRAIRLDDQDAAFFNDLGNALWTKHLVDRAMSAFLRSIELDQNFVQPQFNLGNCYWMDGRYREALDAYARVVELDPDWAQAHYMMGNCLYYLGRTADAIAPYDKAIEKRDNFTDAYLGKATALLKLGRWEEGWSVFDQRVEYPEFAAFRASSRPVWRGEAIPQGSLLVYGEQGIGDVIQFVRFLPQARSRVGRLLLVCDPRLRSLFDGLDGVDRILDKEQVQTDLDRIDFDRRVLLMSLPGVFGVSVDKVPSNVPYLSVEDEIVTSWRKRLDGQGLKVGLVWAGNPAQKDDRFRSCPLSAFSMLGSIPNVTLYSLQADSARSQLKEKAAPPVIDLAPWLSDFRDAAAAITAMDLVISVDTAAAHLAGALGRPVWTLLWYAHCWRYLENSESTPWYPTMRLFKQRNVGDWRPVIEDVAERLKNVASITG